MVGYLGSRRPALSETFICREMRGLRTFGYRNAATSLYPPQPDSSDTVLTALAAQTFVIYSRATMRRLSQSLLRHPGQMLIAMSKALRADHPSLLSRQYAARGAALQIDDPTQPR